MRPGILRAVSLLGERPQNYLAQQCMYFEILAGSPEVSCISGRSTPSVREMSKTYALRKPSKALILLGNVIVGFLIPFCGECPQWGQECGCLSVQLSRSGQGSSMCRTLCAAPGHSPQQVPGHGLHAVPGTGLTDTGGAPQRGMRPFTGDGQRCDLSPSRMLIIAN